MKWDGPISTLIADIDDPSFFIWNSFHIEDEDVADAVEWSIDKADERIQTERFEKRYNLVCPLAISGLCSVSIWNHRRVVKPFVYGSDEGVDLDIHVSKDEPRPPNPSVWIGANENKLTSVMFDRFQIPKSESYVKARFGKMYNVLGCVRSLNDEDDTFGQIIHDDWANYIMDCQTQVRKRVYK